MKAPGKDRLALIACALGTLVLPAFLDDSAVSVYVLMELTAMVTVGVSLLMGYAGQVSLGQAAFYASGAYTAGLLSVHGFPTLLGLLVAPLGAAFLALIAGVPLLRLRGHYLAFATLALHLICLSVLGGMKVTGGDIGLRGIPRLGIGSLELHADRDYAYLAWFALAAIVLLTRNVIDSRPGRALRALASSEVAAASSGVPVGRYKLTVFALSAAYAGLAGGIYAYYVGYLAPGSFPVLMSFQFVVMATVGGLGTVAGALVGTVAITLAVHALNLLATMEGMPSSAPSILSYGVYSVLLITSVLFLPQGAVPALRDWWRRRRARLGSARVDDLLEPAREKVNREQAL